MTSHQSLTTFCVHIETNGPVLRTERRARKSYVTQAYYTILVFIFIALKLFITNLLYQSIVAAAIPFLETSPDHNQGAFSLRDIRIRMLVITRPIWTEFRLNIYTKCFESSHNVNQIFTPTICDIKSLTGSFTERDMPKVSLYYILNISKITRLPAITIDAAYLTVKQLLYKLRNNCCISSIRILSATKHIE